MIFLLLEVVRIGIQNIPPVTLVVGGLNVALHYLFDMKGWHLGVSSLCLLRDLLCTVVFIVSHQKDLCIGASAVWEHKQIYRLVTAAFFHVDDLHLYYNMVSFLLKGRTLEPLLGSKVPSRFLLLENLESNLSTSEVRVDDRVFHATVQRNDGDRQCPVG